MTAIEAIKELEDWYIAYSENEFDTDAKDSKAAFDYAYETGEELGILYTTFEDDDDGAEHDMQVSITLNPAEEIIYVDNQLVFRRRYSCIADLFDAYDGATFDAIFSWADDERRF